MAKIVDGTFTDWQDGETIKAADYVREREVMRTAVNDNDGRLGVVESEIDGISLGTAQLQKITADDGTPKIMINDSTGDLRQSLLATGVGMHTFFADKSSVGLPSSKNFEGVAIIKRAAPPYSGFVLGVDEMGTTYKTFLDGDGWDSWSKVIEQADLDSFLTTITTQKALWTGVALMVGSTTISVSKKLSECRNGWTLVFSDYDPATGKENDYDFSYYNVPKYHSAHFNGKPLFAPLVSSMSSSSVTITTKRLYVYDNQISGHDDNKGSGTTANDVVLRAVLEY